MPIISALMSNTQTVNVSPKVAYPVFVGFAATTLVCVLKHYGIQVDAGTAAGIIVTIMALVGHRVNATNPPEANGTITSETKSNA